MGDTMNNKLVLYGNIDGVINLGNVTEVMVDKDTAFEDKKYHIQKIGINGQTRGQLGTWATLISRQPLAVSPESILGYFYVQDGVVVYTPLEKLDPYEVGDYVIYSSSSDSKRRAIILAVNEDDNTYDLKILPTVDKCGESRERVDSWYIQPDFKVGDLVNYYSPTNEQTFMGRIVERESTDGLYDIEFDRNGRKIGADLQNITKVMSGGGKKRRKSKKRKSKKSKKRKSKKSKKKKRKYTKRRR